MIRCGATVAANGKMFESECFAPCHDALEGVSVDTFTISHTVLSSRTK